MLDTSAVFRNRSSYDKFIIQELWNQFKRQYKCSDKTTKNNIIFSVNIEKEINVYDKISVEMIDKKISLTN